MRALRPALTALPRPGITNCPLLLHSFVAKAASSSRTAVAAFLRIPALLDRCDTICDLVMLFANLNSLQGFLNPSVIFHHSLA